MAETAAARVHRRLNHPVMDADGHWLELMPIFVQYLDEVAGPVKVDEFLTSLKTRFGHSWFAVSPEERNSRRIPRPGWWTYTTKNVEDRAASMLPKLYRERLDDWGIDYAVVYPTMGLDLLRIEDADMRRPVVRAFNVMAADMFRLYADRITPAGICPLHTPAEGIEEAEYAVRQLGLKVLSMNCAVVRPLPADAAAETDPAKRRIYVDCLAMDSAYDYEPVWAKMVELKVAVTNHMGSMGWPDRNSPSNFVAIHLGHFAQANHLFARGLFMGGVTQRFPNLNFGLLEGGAGWACNLLTDLCSHWRTRNAKAVEENCKPSNLDLVKLRKVMEEYTRGDKRFAGKLDELLTRNLEAQRPFMSAEALTERHVGEDDFSQVRIGSEDEVRRLFTQTIYVGCEADDPMTPVAFDPKYRFGVKPILGSDISHFDVVDAGEVLEEAWETVEHGLMTEENFHDFTFGHAVALHGGMNPDFFKGTVVESAAQQLLGKAAAQDVLLT